MKQIIVIGLLTAGLTGATSFLQAGEAQATGLDLGNCPAVGGFCYSNTNGNNYLTLLQGAAAGSSFKITYNQGYIDGKLAEGLTSEAIFTLLNDFTDKTAAFRVDLTNTSSSPITASRVSILGFDVSPELNLALTTLTDNASDGNPDDRDGVFDLVASGQTPQPQFLGSLDFCAKGAGGANNCTGGGGEGVFLGETLTFNPTLVFNEAGNITFTNFYVRYQSIDGQLIDSSGRVTELRDASGIGVGLVPTPAFFLGLIGMGAATLRQKQRLAQTVTETRETAEQA